MAMKRCQQESAESSASPVSKFIKTGVHCVVTTAQTLNFDVLHGWGKSFSAKEIGLTPN